MATKFTSMLLVLLHLSFILQCISTYECQPGDETCDKYLTIYLQTAKDHPFPPSVFASDFDTFASSFHSLCAHICEYDHLPYPSLYYIRVDHASLAPYAYNNTQYDGYDFQFGLNLFCDESNTDITSCCNILYHRYVNGPMYGWLVEAWIKDLNTDTIWQDIELEGYAVDYFWNYKTRDSIFPIPTTAPTLSPIQHTINCQYTSLYLSILCHLQPSYTIYDSPLTTYERSASLCAQLFTSDSLELLGKCENCKTATCQFKNVSYDEGNRQIAIFSIEIFLTSDCTISDNQQLHVCITVNSEHCEHESIAIIQPSSHSNIDALTDSSVTIIYPPTVSSQCMAYTVYNDIQSDIGVTNIKSAQWSNKYQNDFNQCSQNECCTFSATPTANSSNAVIVISVENNWGSTHNISKSILFHDDLAFIAVVFHPTHFVAFKPLYFKTDIILSCDENVINLNVDDWIHSQETNVFSTEWKLQNMETIQSAERNIFINAVTLRKDPSIEQDATFELSVNAQDFEIRTSTELVTTITNNIALERKYGAIKAVISNGAYQYFPYELTAKDVLISLTANEYSFDQEILRQPSDWHYTWNCTTLYDDSLCPISESTEPILQFASTVLQPDAVYMFSLQIEDAVTQRTGETFTILTVTQSVINTIVFVNIEWDNNLYFTPSYHGYTNITASIEDVNDNADDGLLWIYTFCFRPSLQNGVTCQSHESIAVSFTYYIHPFDTLPNHNYIVDVNITSSESKVHNGMVSTILEISPISHIIEVSVSTDYHMYNDSGYSLSSDMYKSLYQHSNSLLEYVNFNLLSMKINCIHPPCSYSYFYQVTNPNKAKNANIPFYFAIANGLSVSPLSGVIFPWSYHALNILGCVADIYGSTTCKLIKYTPSQTHTISDQICDHYTNITNHLTLLSKMKDKLSLSQFMTAVIFEIIDGEHGNNDCFESLIHTILHYTYQHLLTDEYFIHYPFHILQTLYLISENNLLAPNTHSYFIDIYDQISQAYPSQAHTYYFPYSDRNYSQWNVSLVIHSVSYYHAVLSLLDGIDLQCSSSRSIVQDNIYDIIHDVSDAVTDLLARLDEAAIIQYAAPAVYVYARRFEFTVDTQKYRPFVLTERYTDNTTQNDNTLETVSISNSNIGPGNAVELKLLAFNPRYITEQCFTENTANKQHNSSSKTKLVHVSIEHVIDAQLTGSTSRRRQLISNGFMDVFFSWKLSSATMDELKQANGSGFDIYCQQFDVTDNSFSADKCESITDLRDLLSSLDANGEKINFECQCETNGGTGGETYGLTVDIEGDVFAILQTEKYEFAALDQTRWAILLSLYLLLLFGAYILPLCRSARFAPKCQRYTDYEKYFYASMVLGNFLMQIYLCCVGLVSDNTVWLWQIEVIFGLQCGNLGVYNIFLLIVVNDKKCRQFKILKPAMISISNLILTAMVITFMIIRAVLISNAHTFNYDYASSIWSLWMVYFALCCLSLLFIVYLSYYWWKGKHFSGGKPYAYTEGKRETTAIWIMLIGAVLYCFSAINGYITYAVVANDRKSDSYMMGSFECLHWLSLLFLAIVITGIRKFEKTDKRQNRKSILTTCDHKHVPNVDLDEDTDLENEDDGTSSDSDAAMAMIPVDGYMNGQQSIEPSPIKSASNTQVLLGSSMDNSNNTNMNKSLIDRDNNGINEFASTSEDDFMPQIDENEQIMINNHGTHVKKQQIMRMMAQDEEYEEYEMNHQLIPGFIPNSLRMDHTGDNTQTNTDALGNTMSYEPEMDVMDFLDIPQATTGGTGTYTNNEDEGMETPKSDGQLYTEYRNRARHRKHEQAQTSAGSAGWKRNRNGNAKNIHYGYDVDDRDDSYEQKVQYSPYSDHGDSDPGYYFTANPKTRQDHITHIGAAEHAQNGGHYNVINDMEAPANTHRRSTIEHDMDATHSDPEAYGIYPGPLQQDTAHNTQLNLADIQHSNNTNEPTINSTSSVGIFDWNTPPPNNAISQQISLQNLNLNKWINVNANQVNCSSDDTQKHGLSISRRHTVNAMHFRKNKKSIKRVRSANSEGDHFYNHQIAITPSAGVEEEEEAQIYINRNTLSDDKSMPQLYGTGAGASVIMKAANGESNIDSDSPNMNGKRNGFSIFKREKLRHSIDEYGPIKQTHSRQTTATSFTGTFTQPDYPNIITTENDDQHFKILQAQNLTVVPFIKTDLSPHQKEIVHIFEEKITKTNNQLQS